MHLPTPVRVAVVTAALALVLASCQFGNPEPTVRTLPSGSPHRQLLMIGDSLMGQHDAVFGDVLSAHGIDATVIDGHVNSSGLIGPVGDADSAFAWVQEKVAEYPDANPVVIEWAGACAVCGTTTDGTTYPAIGDSAGGFYDLWLSNATQIIDWLHAQGKTVIWTVSPPFGIDPVAVPVRVEAAKWLSMLDTIVIGPHANPRTIDWFNALSDTEGQFAAKLWYDNRFNTVRSDDLTHFTADGATRAARWTLSVLVDVLASMPPPPPSTSSLPVGLVQAGDPVTLTPGGGL